MAASSFKELIVWQKAFRLTELIYAKTKALPSEEKFGLTDQIRRSAVSVCSNIAEGYERNNRAEYIHFLSIARGSSSELEAQLLLAQKLYNIDFAPELALLTEVQKLLWAFKQSLSPTKP